MVVYMVTVICLLCFHEKGQEVQTKWYMSKVWAYVLLNLFQKVLSKM